MKGRKREETAAVAQHPLLPANYVRTDYEAGVRHLDKLANLRSDEDLRIICSNNTCVITEGCNFTCKDRHLESKFGW